MYNNMLSIPEKKTTSVDLYRPLRSYIASNYSESEAQSLDPDLHKLNKLRSYLEEPNKPLSLDERRKFLQSYYSILLVVQFVFPISSAEDDVNVTFTWQEASEQKQKRRQIQEASQQNIHLEKIAVLFNLGAVYSQIGLSCDRSTKDGRREAVQAFISAAGAFAYLKEEVAAKESVGCSATVDVSVECARMLEKLMFAQAEECAFANSIAKDCSAGACAKIARQVALYYEEVLAALKVAPLEEHVPKDWRPHVQLKAAYFFAEACYRYGLDLHKKGEVGEEIARLKIGISALSEAKKSKKNAPPQLLRSIKDLKATIKSSLDRAIEDNDRIYHMRVPFPNSLSGLPSFPMCKPKPRDEILDPREEKMFASLVDYRKEKLRSMYSEKVEKIIRNEAEKLGACSEFTRAQLKKMNLPDSIQVLERCFTLPADLKKDVKAVQISGGRAGLESMLQQLWHLKQRNGELLVQIEALRKEATEDAQFRDRSGTRGIKSPSSTLTENLQDLLNKFAGDQKQAEEGYARVKRSVNDHSALMSILDRPPIESAFPIVGTLKQSLRQLDILGGPGECLLDNLEHLRTKDDILPKLSVSTGSGEDLFKNEISKYKPPCEEIAQNIEAREQLLRQIQIQHHKFSSVSKLEDNEASFWKCCKQIQDAIAKYREIEENINEVLKFNVNLQNKLTNMLQQCGKFVTTNNIQYRDMIGSVSDVYGQAASDSVAGSNLEETIQLLLEMGGGTWDKDTVVRALRAADSNPERAVEYICSVIPKQTEVPPAAGVPSGAQAANLRVQPAQRAQPAPAMPRALTVMPADRDREAIERLEALGFDRAIALREYFTCNKNEELAANSLLDKMHSRK